MTETTSGVCLHNACQNNDANIPIGTLNTKSGWFLAANALMVADPTSQSQQSEKAVRGRPVAARPPERKAGPTPPPIVQVSVPQTTAPRPISIAAPPPAPSSGTGLAPPGAKPKGFGFQVVVSHVSGVLVDFLLMLSRIQAWGLRIWLKSLI